MTKVEILRRVPLLTELPEDDLQLICNLASVQKYRRGDIIFFEEDPGDALHVVISGIVRIYRLADDGREKTLAYVTSGEFFGEMALLDGGARSAVAEALEPTETLVIYGSDFTGVLANHPRISLEIIKVLCRRLRQTNAQLMNIIFRDARNRVISSLLELATNYGSPSGSRTRIDLKLTHQEMANLVGTARETISRILAELQDEGLLHLDEKRMIVVDTRRLRTLLE
ncbi:MAG TPA: Crp/Fnr family transcriptional regulator [Firmicutes bacterium]|nr:Crp/Fnr family transcriptional regulator [Bacillota bacterium]